MSGVVRAGLVKRADIASQAVGKGASMVVLEDGRTVQEISGFDWDVLAAAISTIDWGIQTAAAGVNILRYIPPGEWPAIFAKTSTYDASAAIDIATASLSGGSLFFPDGKFRITSEWIVDGKINFTICGSGTIDTSDIPMAVPKQNKIQFKNCSSGIVSGITIEGDISPAEVAAGDDTAQIEVTQDCENITVDRIRVVPAAGKQLCHGVAMYGNNSTLQNSYIADGQEFGVIVIRSRASDGKARIVGNTIKDFSTNIEPAYDTSNVFIEGNTSLISGTVGSHITIWPKGPTGGIVDNVVISGNYFKGGATWIYMPIGDAIGNVADGIRNVEAFGNVIEGIVGSSTVQATFFDTTDVYIKGVKIHGNMFLGMQAPMIRALPNNSATLNFNDVEITDNTFNAVAGTVENWLQTYMGAGAYTGATAFSNWKVRNNTLENLGTAATGFLVSLKHTSGFEFEGNTLNGTDVSSGSFKDIEIISYCGRIVIKNNKNLNKITDVGGYANTSVYNNTGIVTESAGVLTIASGASIGYSAHGLELSKLGVGSFNNGRMNITPTNAAAAALNWYIFNNTATQIDFRSTTAAAADATFAWSASFSKP